MNRRNRSILEEAIVDEVVIRGFRGATVDGICARAGLTARDYHRHFVDLEDGYCQTLDRLRQDIFEHLLPAFAAATPTWRDQMRAVSHALLDYVEDDRRRAWFMVVESAHAGDRAQVIVEEAVTTVTELVDQGRQELDDPERLSRATAEAITGGVFAQIRVAVEADLPNAFELTPQLMFNVVQPYLGPEEALRELEIEPARAVAQRARRN